jgi:hypothetical protein
MRFGSDLAALQQGINSALSLTFLEAVLGCELSHKIIVALERGQILLGELAPALMSLSTICLIPRFVMGVFEVVM